jgi:hypothetical protein
MIGTSTAYRYRHQVVAVLAAAAPHLPGALPAAHRRDHRRSPRPAPPPRPHHMISKRTDPLQGKAHGPFGSIGPSG